MTLTRRHALMGSAAVAALPVAAAFPAVSQADPVVALYQRFLAEVARSRALDVAFDQTADPAERRRLDKLMGEQADRATNAACKVMTTAATTLPGLLCKAKVALFIPTWEGEPDDPAVDIDRFGPIDDASMLFSIYQDIGRLAGGGAA